MVRAMNNTLPQLIGKYSVMLDHAGIDQSLAEVELILCHLLNVDRLHLYLDSEKLITEQHIARLDEIIAKRCTRYPLQFILGEAWFYGRRFIVTPAVMAPTPETELLCETALKIIGNKKLSSPRILDIGVGSGVISVTLAKELPDCKVVAVDISTEALDVARQNVLAYTCADKIELRQSDFFSAVKPDEQFDIIISNPPYIAEPDYDTLPPEVLADPKIAMTAGTDGLDAIRVIVQEAPNYLAPNGRIMFEIGCEQAEQVAKLTETDNRYSSIDILKDLNDRDRIIVLACNNH